MGILSCIAVMFVSAISALFAEAFSWYMVYRKPDYQRLKRHIETIARDLEKKKAEPVGMDSAKKREKGQRLITRLEKDLADAMKELQALATPSKLAVAALVMAVMFGVKKSFEGIVVAKLPFVPFSLLQKISHRGLEGEDPTDCAVPFLFALCQATVKANISKLVSVGQPKGVKEPSPFADLSAQYDEAQAKTQ
eukprot:jgi/Undpi1/1042/HiC_scaffold_10.g04505.m1